MGTGGQHFLHGTAKRNTLTLEFEEGQAKGDGEFQIDASTRSLLTYAIRAPRDYKTDSTRKWSTVLILHGSNMNGRSYVSTIASIWPEFARDFLLLGLNGDNRV